MPKLKDDIYRVNNWEASYKRGENNILYPQTEVIKFLNRFIVKKTSLVNSKKNKNKKKCLDFACGVGIHSITCEEFGIEAYGVDISEYAINQAKINANQKGMSSLVNRLEPIVNQNQKIDFEDNFFDFSIAESCLDSMEFEYAKSYFKELKRVTKDVIYFSVISSIDNNNATGDHIVETEHENQTIQCYFDQEMILEMTDSSLNNFKYLKLIVEDDMQTNEKKGRFYCVLEMM